VTLPLATALALGLVGSLHCAGMCGPLALALPVAGKGTTGFLLGRVAYNLGRVVTYAALGGVFGLAGQGLLLAGLQRWVSITLGVLLIVGLLLSRRVSLAPPVVRLVGALKTRMAGLLQRRSFLALGVLGLLNGLLPCGLVYVACAGAAATGGWLTGAGYMAVFGLGTVPMMFGLSLSGRLLTPGLRLKLRYALPVSVLALGLLLVLRGLSLGIPYLSPDLSAEGGGCCHLPAGERVEAVER
jgi:sulfite exporter TauE/SafE